MHPWQGKRITSAGLMRIRITTNTCECVFNLSRGRGVVSSGVNLNAASVAKV